VVEEMKRKTNILGAMVLASLCAALVAMAQNVPFMESFEDRTVGALHNQSDWQARRQNDAQVQSATVFAGSKAGTVGTNAVVWHNFTNTTVTNVWIDFYTRSAYPTNSSAPSLTGSVAAAFYVAQDGGVRAISNDTWVTLSYTVSCNTWHRFTVNLDYNQEIWSLFAADSTPNTLSTILSTNLAFSSTSTNEYFRRFRMKN